MIPVAPASTVMAAATRTCVIKTFLSFDRGQSGANTSRPLPTVNDHIPVLFAQPAFVSAAGQSGWSVRELALDVPGHQVGSGRVGLMSPNLPRIPQIRPVLFNLVEEPVRVVERCCAAVSKSLFVNLTRSLAEVWARRPGSRAISGTRSAPSVPRRIPPGWCSFRSKPGEWIPRA